MPCGQSFFKTATDGFNAGLQALKIAFRLHAHNAVAIRAAQSAQKQSLGKAVKAGQDKTVPPQTNGLAARAGVWLDPLKIAALGVNFVEFDTNRQYHGLHRCCGVAKATRFLGVLRSANRHPLFINKKATSTVAHLIR